MPKTFAINCSLHWDEAQDRGHIFKYCMSLGLHTCLKLRVCLYDRLGLQIDEPDFFLIFRQVNALCAWQGPEEHCPSARLKLPSQSKQIWALAECRVQAEFQLALLQAHLCFLLLSKFSPQPHLENQCSALHLLPPSSHLECPVGALCRLPSCTDSYSTILQKQNSFKKKRKAQIVFYPSTTKQLHGETNQSEESSNTSQKVLRIGKKKRETRETKREKKQHPTVV